jgi:quinol monooxygenase YgiN
LARHFETVRPNLFVLRMIRAMLATSPCLRRFSGRRDRGGKAGFWEETMPVIKRGQPCQTVLTTFETTPGSAHDLMEALQSAYAEVISKQPGFISAALHINDAQTRIANYSQWQKREDFQAMLRTEEMRKRNREINGMCKSFEPVMYDVEGVY